MRAPAAGIFHSAIATCLLCAPAGLLCVPAGPLPAQTESSPPPGLSTASPLSQARHLLATGHLAEAEAALRRLLLASPPGAASPDPEIRYLLAYTLLREGRPRDALAEYTAAAQQRQPTAADLRNVANAYALLPDYPDAAHWIERSLALDPLSADTWYDLGRIRFSQGRFADALAGFNRALSLAPRSSKIENNIGLSLEGLNRTPEAIAAYRQAISWQRAESPPPPSPEQPLLNLAIALLRRGDPAEAAPLLTEAARFAPNDPRIHEQLGKLALATGDLPSAERELELAVHLDPGNSALHFLLGQSYRRAGRPAQAASEFRLAGTLTGQRSTPDAP